MRIPDKNLFVTFGLVAYSLFIGLLFMLASMLLPGGTHSALPVIMLIVGIYVAGWVALIPGRRLNCESCGQPVLSSDRYGFRGLTFGSLLRASKGHLICSVCSRKS